VHHHGAPAGMTRTFLQSGLTRFVVNGRTGAQSGDAQVDVRYAPADGCAGVTLQLFSTVTLPYSLTMHVPAGPWSVGQFAQDSIAGPARRYAAGHSYVATVGAAVWGPGGRGGLPKVDPYCRCLIASTNEMFADPALSNGGDARVTYTLRKRGTTIASKVVYSNVGAFTPPLRSGGWYSLTEVATRHPIKRLPANVMSPRSVLRLHFYADPTRTMQVGGLITRFVPRGLGRDNRARSKTTTVSLGLLRARGPASDRSVPKTVRVWMSNDFGHTWRAVRVRNVDGAWSATIPNPASGYVSLRSTVVDTHSNTATTEIFRAYGVG